MAKGKLTAWTVPFLLVSTGVVFSPTVQAGGGTTDWFSECDFLNIACAAAAAVALSGCATAYGNVTISFFLSSGLAGIVQINGKIEACQSVAIAQALSGTDLFAGNMFNEALGGRANCGSTCVYWSVVSGEYQRSEHTCQSTLGGTTTCGTGATYQIDQNVCVAAHAHADVNEPLIFTDTTGDPRGTWPIKVGQASANANAFSSPCHSKETVKIDFGDTFSQASTTSVPFSSLDATTQHSLRSDLRAVFDQQLAEATASWPENDLMNQLRSAVEEEAHNAVENFEGNVEATQ